MYRKGFDEDSESSMFRGRAHSHLSFLLLLVVSKSLAGLIDDQRPSGEYIYIYILQTR